jgi:hypothetical protein
VDKRVWGAEVTTPIEGTGRVCCGWRDDAYERGDGCSDEMGYVMRTGSRAARGEVCRRTTQLVASKP